LVVWPTSIAAGGVVASEASNGSPELGSDGAESRRMSASDREQAGAF
jgi:hypothetical protein